MEGFHTKFFIYFNLKIVLALSEDGSGRGAAVAAAVATRMSRIIKEKQEIEAAKRLGTSSSSKKETTQMGNGH